MWRPCVWPPEHEDNSINCEGGKLVAYVYHMFKEHWCGDDFEYSNEQFARVYRTNREPEVPKDFFQPEAGDWYTVWSHVKMNTAGCAIHMRGFGHVVLQLHTCFTCSGKYRFPR